MQIGRYALAVGCALVFLTALALAWEVTAWALVVAPFALLVGLAAWRGVGLRTTLRTLADASDDVGSGPAGMTP